MNPLRWLVRQLLGRRLAMTSGTLRIVGPHAPITIRRDGYGIPVIEAENDHDAWFGLGFCHGQDRPLQLEMLLRLSRGTLAELVGPVGVRVDRLSRRIGFARSAADQFNVLAPHLQAQVQAYTDGINFGSRDGLSRPPHEFALLRTPISVWTPLDALAGFKLQSFLLASNWDVELARLMILRADGPAALTALEPDYPHWQYATSPPGERVGPLLDRLGDDIRQFMEHLGLGGGSNNWVISGQRTASGRPLLANDPHLSPSLPNHWYLAHLRTPEWAVCGATFVGTPSFPSAHNGHCAWGITAGLIDNTDLFLEQLSDDGQSYRDGERFERCRVVRETINIRGGAPIVEEVHYTGRGPLLTDMFDGVSDALSLRAVWLDPRPLRGLMEVPKMRNFAEFRATFAEWPAMPLNVVYADAEGTIGWQMAGDAPIRVSGAHLLPVPGWLADNQWESDCVPFRAMPMMENPPIGFIATANNRPEPAGIGPHLGADFVDGYRVGIIVDELQSHVKWTVDQCLALQQNVRCQPWAEMRNVVLDALEPSEDIAEAINLLRNWDGELSIDSPGARLYQGFIAELLELILSEKAPNSSDIAWGQGAHPLMPMQFFAHRRIAQLVRWLREQPDGFLRNGWPVTIRAAVETAWAGCKSTGLRGWGRARPLVLKHMLLGERKPWNRVFNLGPYPCGGDDNTPNQAAVEPMNFLGATTNIAGLRVVIDVGAWSGSRFILAGGQSGNPMSPHYGDMVPIWQRGDGVPIAWTEPEIAAATRATLRLEPLG